MERKQKGAVCCQESLSWICWMFTTPDTAVWDSWVGISRYLFCSRVQFNSQTLRSSSKSAFMAERLLTLQTDGRQGGGGNRRRRGAQISFRGCKRDFRQDAFSSDIPRRPFSVSYATLLLLHDLKNNAWKWADFLLNLHPRSSPETWFWSVSSSSFIVMRWWHHLQTHWLGLWWNYNPFALLFCSVKGVSQNPSIGSCRFRAGLELEGLLVWQEEGRLCAWGWGETLLLNGQSGKTNNQRDSSMLVSSKTDRLRTSDWDENIWLFG